MCGTNQSHSFFRLVWDVSALFLKINTPKKVINAENQKIPLILGSWSCMSARVFSCYARAAQVHVCEKKSGPSFSCRDVLWVGLFSVPRASPLDGYNHIPLYWFAMFGKKKSSYSFLDLYQAPKKCTGDPNPRHVSKFRRKKTQ